MPKLVQLQKQYPDRLVVVTLNVDFDSTDGMPGDELIAEAAATLERLDVFCSNRLSTDPMEDVLSEFEFFGLPAAILYAAGGNVAARFDGDADVASMIAPAVAKLLVDEK